MKKIKKIAKKAKPSVVNNATITDCELTGVKWDAPSLEVLKIVASGLTNLTELFKSQHFEIKNLVSLFSSSEIPNTDGDDTYSKYKRSRQIN